MKALSSSPKIMDFLNRIPFVNDWLQIVNERFKIYKIANGPAIAEIPKGQWAVVKTTSPAQTALIANDESGNLLRAQLVARRPYIRATDGGGATVIPTGVWTRVTLGTEVIDSENTFAASRFTPTQPGHYYVSGQTAIVAGAAAFFIGVGIYKNGVAETFIVQPTAAQAGNQMAHTGCLVVMNGTTDYLELFAFQGSGGNLNTALAEFNAFYVGP